MFDLYNLVRIAQLNNPEVSGYILDVVLPLLTGFGSTGQLTGQYYPLNSNPSGYIQFSQTGIFVTTNNTGNFVTYDSPQFISTIISEFGTVTGILNNVFYPLNSNPTGYLTTGNLSGLGEILFIYDNSGSFNVTSLNGSISGSGIIIFGNNLLISGIIENQNIISFYGLSGQNLNFLETGNNLLIFNTTGNLAFSDEYNNLTTLTQLLLSTGNTGNYYPLNTNPSGYLTTGEISGLGNIVISYNNSGYITISQASGSINASGTSILGSNITFSGTDLTKPTLIIYGNSVFDSGITITGSQGTILFPNGNFILTGNHLNNQGGNYIVGGQLINYLGIDTVDWQNMILYQKLGNCSIDWQNRLLEDNLGAGATSLDWHNRITCDNNSQDNNGAGITSIDWQNRNLQDSHGNFTGESIYGPGVTAPGTLSVDWQNRRLWDNTGNLAIGNGVLGSGKISVDWNNRLLNNNLGNTTINYENCILLGSNYGESIDWSNAYLIDNNGYNSIAWNNYLIFDGAITEGGGHNVTTSIDYANRLLFDNNNEPATDYSNGITSIDYQNRYLYDTNPTLSIDYGNRILTGNWSVQKGLFSSGLFISGNPVTTGGPYLLSFLTGQFVTTGQTGNFNQINTGVLTGLFYPLYKNPSGYITGLNTGIFVTTGQTGNFVTSFQTGLLKNTFAQLTTINTFTKNNTFSGNLTITGNNSFIYLTRNSYIQNGNLGSIITIGDILNPSYLDWILGQTYDDSINNVISLDWFNRYLYDSNATISIDYSNRLLYDSGSNISLDYNNRILSGNWFSANLINTGQTGNFAIATNLSSTGSYLLGLINASSAGVSSLNSASGALNLNGVGNITVTTIGQNITISGNTGILTGTFALNSNTGLFITSNQTGNFITSSQTGVFTSVSITGSTTQSYLNLTGISGITINLTGNYGLINGNVLQTQITNVVNGTGNFISSFQTGNFITNSQTGIFITTGQTGSFGGGIFNTGNLVNTFTTQTISGYKIFNSGIGIPSGAFISGQNGYLGMIDTSKNLSIDWINRYLVSNNNNIIDWGNQIFKDNVGVNALSFSQSAGRELLNANGSPSIDWANNYAIDTNNFRSIDWNNRWIYDSNSSPTKSIDYGNRYLYDSSQILSVDYSNRILSGNWSIQNLQISGNNVVTNPAWSYLNFNTGTTIWTGAQNVVEDKRILIMTGKTTLSISGLYNGWIGLLQTIQSGSGFNLTLPIGTKVSNNGSGIVYLTTGISGARDFIGFEYDGINLYATIANYFN